MIQFADLFKDCMSQFRETPEFTILNKHRVQGESLTAQERQAIFDSVELMFAPLFDQIKSDASSLTDSDLVFCVLSNIGIGATTIADCLTISPHTVRVRKHRMREKLPASWYDVFYGEGGNDEEPVVEVSHESRLPFVREISNGFRNYFNTNGRVSRSEYFCFYFFWVIVTHVSLYLQQQLYCLSYNASNCAADGFFFVLLHVVIWIVLLGIMPPMLTITVRRLHDLNCSGWLSLLICGLPCAILIADTILGAIFTDEFFGRATWRLNVGYYVLRPIRFGYQILNGMFFVQLLIFSIRGTKGTNDYGPDPLK